jgi:uncharacterized membrane protein YcfT
MALLGALTGVISAVVPDSVANAVQPVSSLFFLTDSSAHPGLFYGPVVSLGVWWAGERRAWVIISVFLITVLAWSAALNTALWVYDIKDERVLLGQASAGKAGLDATPAVKLLTGFVAGIVGATVLVLGCALVIPVLRRAAPILLTIVVGGLAGLLLYPFLSDWPQTLSLAILLSVWQASVGACLGHWLRNNQPDH